MGTLPLPAVLCVFPSLLLPLEKCLFFSVINPILDLKYCVIPITNWVLECLSHQRNVRRLYSYMHIFKNLFEKLII